MEFDIRQRRTGKTTRLLNSLVIEMIKHPDNIILFYTMNKCNLPEFIKNNRRIKINPANVRGLEGNKLSLFVDDVNMNVSFQYIFNREKIFILYPQLKNRSYFSVDAEYDGSFIKELTK